MLQNALSDTFKEKLANSLAQSDLLLNCDFDGTLVPFTDVPVETKLAENTEELLRTLAGMDRVHLAVISGRDYFELTGLVDVDNVILAGNHGLVLRWEDGQIHRPELSDDISKVVAKIKDRVEGIFGNLNGIFIEDKGIGITVHYRKYGGNAEQVKDQFRSIWNDLQIPNLELIEGAKLLEVRPAHWNKGDAVKLIQEDLPGIPTIYLGDDTTDEDAFSVLREQDEEYPIVVGNKSEHETNAQLYLREPAAVTKFLRFVRSIYE